MSIDRKNSSALAIILVVVVVLVAVGVWYYEAYTSATPPGSAPVVPVATTTPSTVTYTNSQYGFNFLLPSDWQGYSVFTKQWNGYAQGDQGAVTAATGTAIYLRNPNWTATDPYEDIPILVFTTAQWNSYQAEDFSISPAPISGSELGSNNRYVFVLPPRYDYDFRTGYQEVEEIVQATSSLQAFNL